MMTYEDRMALSSALRSERLRLDLLGRSWDVADVLDVVEAFIDARGGLRKPGDDEHDKRKPPSSQ